LGYDWARIMLTLPGGEIVEEITCYPPAHGPAAGPPIVLTASEISGFHFGADGPTVVQYRKPSGECGVLVNMALHIKARRSSLVLPTGGHLPSPAA